MPPLGSHSKRMSHLQIAFRAVHEDGLTLVEEEDGVVDLRLAEDKLQDRPCQAGSTLRLNKSSATASAE